jgi:uncharacterized BrkB/YihY/UPF0761 family membrane protein
MVTPMWSHLDRRMLPCRMLIELLPGAVLIAVGVQVFYLFTTLFLGPKLASATELYGLIGIVGTILFWLYIVGRLMIGGAILNASIHERGTGHVPR